MHNYNFNRIRCCSPVSMQVEPIDKRYMRSKWNGLLYKRASAMTLNLQRTNKMTFKITIAFNKLASMMIFDTFFFFFSLSDCLMWITNRRCRGFYVLFFHLTELLNFCCSYFSFGGWWIRQNFYYTFARQFRWSRR